MSEPIRFGGMNSGLDTESIIEAMMTSYQTKIDNQNKKLTMLQWQQEAYHDVSKKLSEFQNKYFDVLKRDTYLMSSSTFNKFNTDITSNGTSTNGLKVLTSSSSKVGSHKLKVSQVASASTVKGAEIVPHNFELDADKALRSVNYTDTTEGNVTTRKYDLSLSVQVGSVKKTVNFSAEGTVGADGTVDMDALKQNMLDNLNTELQANFGYSGRSGDNAEGAVDADTNMEWFLQAEMNAEGGFDFLIGGNTSVTVSENIGNFGLTDATKSLNVSMGSAVTGTNTASVEVDGVVKTVSFEGVSSTYYESKNKAGNEKILAEYYELKEAAYRKEYKLSDTAKIDATALENYAYSDLQAAKDKNSASLTDALNTAFKSENVSFSLNDGTLRAAKNGKAAEFTMQMIEGGTLGLAKASVSNKITSKTSLEDLGVAANADGKYVININGVDISVNADATVDALVSAVNKSDAGVTMSYSALSNSFTVEAKEMGGAGAIEIKGTDLTKAMGLTDDSGEEVNFTLGQNAVIEIDGETIYLNDNTYTLEGTTFTINEDIELGTTFNVGITKSYDDVKQTIKDFVADYNQLIEDVYEHIGNKPKTDSSDNKYEPLTDAEKAEMSEEEIEKWEETAKIGVIYNDSTVTRIMSQMRSVLYNSVELEDGSKIGLYSLGIKTSNDYKAHGKLEIDENALDAIFESDPEAVTALFTDAENGIMKQLDSVIDKAIKSTGSAENRGSLVRKAGLENSSTIADSSIFKEMERLTDRLSDLQDRYSAREEYWWSVFTNLESMMSDLNSQSSYMASYLGTGTY